MSKTRMAIVIHHSDDRMILVSASPPKRADFRVAAKVLPGTYACSLVDRFYEHMCGRAIDVRKEYEVYYQPEYETVLHMLFHKYCVSARVLKQLSPAVDGGAYVGVVERSWGRDWQMQSMIENCETGVTTLASAVGVKWAQKPVEIGHED